MQQLSIPFNLSGDPVAKVTYLYSISMDDHIIHLFYWNTTLIGLRRSDDGYVVEPRVNITEDYSIEDIRHYGPKSHLVEYLSNCNYVQIKRLLTGEKVLVNKLLDRGRKHNESQVNSK